MMVTPAGTGENQCFAGRLVFVRLHPLCLCELRQFAYGAKTKRLQLENDMSPAKDGFILAIDQGTTSSRAILFDGNQKIISMDFSVPNGDIFFEELKPKKLRDLITR